MTRVYAIGLTVLVHALLLVLLWWGASWVQVQPVEIEVWDAGSLGGSQSSVEPMVSPSPAISTPTPEAIVKNEPAVEPAEITTKPMQKETQAKQIEAIKDKTPPKPQPTTPSKPSNNVLNTAKKGTSSQSSSGAGDGGADVEGYKSAVKRRIEAAAGSLGGKSAVVAINVSATGQVLGKRIARSSGDAAWDSQLLSTINRLPPNAPDSVQNWGLQLTIRP